MQSFLGEQTSFKKMQNTFLGESNTFWKTTDILTGKHKRFSIKRKVSPVNANVLWVNAKFCGDAQNGELIINIMPQILLNVTCIEPDIFF